MDTPHNILISSAGKRVELLTEFQRELKSFYPDAIVVAVDLNPEMAPACHLAGKAVAVPRVTDPSYPSELLRICRDNGVRLVIPTIDTELAVLAAHRQAFAAHGIEIMVAAENFIASCRDKRLTNRLFDNLGIPYPAPRNKNRPIFPMFAKPFDGSLSTNIHVITNAAQLTDEILNDPKLMFMELVDKTNFKEFTVDVYYDKRGDAISIVPRERLEIRSGEINKGITRKNHIIDFLKPRIGHLEGVRGCICIQLFFNPDTDQILAIEINPRFGGGYPLSYYAGANFPRMLIREYMLGETVEYSEDWQDNTVMLRYDSQIIFNGGLHGS